MGAAPQERQSGDLSGRRGSHAMNVPLSENDMVYQAPVVVVQLLLVGARAAVGVGSCGWR